MVGGFCEGKGGRVKKKVFRGWGKRRLEKGLIRSFKFISDDLIFPIICSKKINWRLPQISLITFA